MFDLIEKINQKQSKLAVIGLGYVGLPVACLFAEAGFEVVGVDLKADRVEKINAGISPIEGDEPGLSELISEVLASKKLHATSQYEELSDRDIILVDVETPVDENHVPQYVALRSALSSLGRVLKDDALVIIESTIAPGTMCNLALPILEETSGRRVGEGFYLGNCPERVMPGKLIYNLRAMSRVCGGGDPQTTQAMIALYRNIVKADLDSADWITAELVKTVENAYRDVQIAFANEIALICEAVNADVWKVRELVNKSPFRNMHEPGAGVGGHCIPKDPWLLAYGVERKNIALRVIPAARAVNESMPHHMVHLVEQALVSTGRSIKSAKVLVLGYAYLENSDDTRNSPSERLVEHLNSSGAEVIIHDPFIADFNGNVYELAQDCDAAVIMVKHSEYLHLDLGALKAKMRLPLIIDGRHVLDGDRVAQSGFKYLGVGVNK